MTLQQQITTEKFINLFERGNPNDWGYANVENDGDGNGLTVGEDGYGTATGDALQVVRLYQLIHPQNRLTPYLPELERLAIAGSDGVSHLSGFGQAWKFEAQNQSFRRAQDSERNDVYFEPAMALARKYRFVSALAEPALAQAAIWDAATQRGFGTDMDSVEPVLKRSLVGFDNATQEQRLRYFLLAHRHGLAHPFETEKTDCWSQSVSRVDVWLELLDADNWGLNLPVTIHTSDYAGTVIE